MVLYVCSVRDRATEAFMRPFYVHRPAEAVRSFSDEVKRKPTDQAPNAIGAHPSDYELWQLALFDDETGKFTDAPERLVRGEDVDFGR